ncbi:hypothetical protein [Acinetobacter baumannii]|uniref:hypothetical protein n=3 Tax=Acinetobacter baumannii TaxID=470 RepID=UPI000DE7174F|nr:hypothetical protein [Acinetobacter baumannii]MCJ9007439.1 hypothetical protein [Acinetobacter baumannii]MCJ9366746.1 hypothetical protein [Acinetobacter baumannii]MCJ9462003.1 hypothetical protein [Acinetobacter baumannii]MDP7885798.1 hypothetical protein [Acinetobacter baumannii]SST95908.1 Uncharacterised protein [Acinetobacter baumannii]
MRIKVHVQTIILICSFITIILFGFIYYLLLGNEHSSVGTVKESLTLTASFFGGICTMAAAYVATILFNDWKAPYHQNKLDECLESLYELCSKLTKYFALEYAQKITKVQNVTFQSLQKLSNQSKDEDLDLILNTMDELFQEIVSDMTNLSQLTFKINASFRKYTKNEHEVIVHTNEIITELNNIINDFINFKATLLVAIKNKSIKNFILSEDHIQFWKDTYKPETLIKFTTRAISIQTLIKDLDSSSMIKDYLLRIG